ncbi:elongation factor P [candidate division KSB1 bacterium]|nr:elongation factor P [candidate division KSB1 bacterium]
MASTSDFRTGLVLILDGELFAIAEFQHVKMARGGAFVRTKLKNFKTGRVIERTFRSGEKVDEARIVRRRMQFLYREGEQLVVMDNETYDQVHIAADMLGTGIDFLKESENIDVLTHNDNPVGAEMPTFVVLTVASTAPGLRGDTVSGATKKAKLETGGSINVPLFVEEGDRLKVDTRTGEYIERVKE